MRTTKHDWEKSGAENVYQSFERYRCAWHACDFTALLLHIASPLRSEDRPDRHPTGQSDRPLLTSASSSYERIGAFACESEP
jgi:hypothetical protein